MAEKKKRKHHFQAWEDQVIKNEWRTSTDKEIAAKISRTEEAVARRRKTLGLSKKSGRPSKGTTKEAIFANPTEYSLATLSKEDRLQFYKTQFDKNYRYPTLCKVLMPDELVYYKHKYIQFMDSIDTITLQEEELLHNMIMTEVQIVRLQEQIKDQLEAYRDDDNEDKRPPPQYLYEDLNKAEARYLKYQEKLNLTREQRLKTNREEKITITSIVSSLMDSKVRHESGNTAGVMSYFTDKSKEDMKKMDFLLGM